MNCPKCGEEMVFWKAGLCSAKEISIEKANFTDDIGVNHYHDTANEEKKYFKCKNEHIYIGYGPPICPAGVYCDFGRKNFPTTLEECKELDLDEFFKTCACHEKRIPLNYTKLFFFIFFLLIIAIKIVM